MSQHWAVPTKTRLGGCGSRALMTRGLLAAILLALVTCTPTASAAPKSFNGFVGGAAGVNTGGLFTQPRDVAVYTAGTPSSADDRVFLVEALSNNSRVHRLDGNGNFELMWGQDVIRATAPGNTGEGYEVCTAAVSSAAGCKFASSGTGAGEFDDPTGLAVNQSTGHVYVMDRDNRRVQEFDLDGQFVRAWGWDVVQTGGTGDDTTPPANQFEICTVASQCQTGAVGEGAGQFAAASHNTLTISPIAPHDVFVTDSGNRRILQFQADGDFVQGWGFDVAAPDGGGFETCTGSACRAGSATGTANGQFASNQPQHIAVDSTGVVYASDSNASNRIIRFDTVPAPALLDALPSPTVLSSGETRGIEVDTGNLLAARDPGAGPTVVEEIADPSAALPPDGPPNPTIIDTHAFSDEGAVQGLSGSSATGRIYLSSTSLFPPPNGSFTGCNASACHGIVVLATPSGGLAADLSAPSDVGTTTASLEGVVDPGGGIARYRFQVSTDGSSWVDAAEAAYVGGSGPVSASVEASGLEPATLYRTRLLVSKQTGISTTESVVSNEDVFLTDAAAPAVTTLGSSRRTDTSARLRGSVDPQGSATSYRFEYGPAGESFDHHLPIQDAQVGSGNSPQVVLQDVTGLQPETAYQYRIVATNFVGPSVGETVTFTTDAQGPTPPEPPGRAYELVSPANKLSGVGAGIWFNGPAAAGVAGHAAYDGDRFAVRGTNGAVLVDGEYALANDWALAERTPQGWVSKPLLSRRAHGAHPIVFIEMHSSTPTMSLMSWGETTVKLFAEMESWSKEIAGATLYLRDWDQGRWETFGPLEETQGGADGLTRAGAIAANGKAAVAWGNMRGLAGLGDSTLDQSPGAASVYLDEIPNGPSDVFPGIGVRSPVNACTDGLLGSTMVPRRLASGKIGEQGCAELPERQVVTISDATGGTFALTFDGQSTNAIAFDASSSVVQAALEGLSNLDPGDIESVGVAPGDSSATNPYLVRFNPALGDIPELTVDGSALTGGEASATVHTQAVAPLIDRRGAALTRSPERAISTDGSRVVFMAPDPGSAADQCSGSDATTACPAQVYLRQRNSDEVVTRWISRTEVTQANGASADQDASLVAPAISAGASADGDKVFFWTTAPLTSDDPNGQGQTPPPGGVVSGSPDENSGDLYMYDLPDAPDADPADGDLVRISAGPTGNSECGAPNGSLRFASEDGSQLYLTCSIPLDGVPVTGSGTSTTPGSGGSAVNLYAYDATRSLPERWRFIARVPTGDPIGPCATTGTRTGMPIGPLNDADFKVTIFTQDPDVNCVRGVEDGSMITFWTVGQLTDDDPDATSGDIYAYDAIEDELTRVSAPQGGIGGTYSCAPGTSSIQCYGDGGIGPSNGNVPLPALGVAQDPDNGERMVFFQSKARLIPGDHDTHHDVYQWRSGELSLISSDAPGTSDAFFKGNDYTGTNVYLATRDRLSWQDRDEVLDIYSARVGQGIPQPPDTQEPCNPVLDECQETGQPIQTGQTDSDTQTDGNPPRPPRVALTIARPSAKALRKAARTGRVKIRLTTTGPAIVTLTAKARIAKKNRQIAHTTKQASNAGAVTLTLRLNTATRKRLRTRRALAVTLTASAPGSRPDAIRLRLAR